MSRGGLGGGPRTATSRPPFIKLWQLAMPAFSTLSPGFSHRSGTAAVTCSNIEPSLDYNGVEFNRIFWFSIRDNDGVSAAVTVHLHHSTRLEQVQGAAIIHNGTVAALWFVKNHFSSNSVDLWATTSPPSTKLSSRTTSRVQAMATHQTSIVTFAASLSENLQNQLSALLANKPIIPPAISNTSAMTLQSVQESFQE